MPKIVNHVFTPETGEAGASGNQSEREAAEMARSRTGGESSSPSGELSDQDRASEHQGD